METTFFVLLPEAMKSVATIALILDWRRIKPYCWKPFDFEESMLAIYSSINANPLIAEECRTHLLGKRCLLGIIQAENAIQRLVEAAGHHHNPSLCGRNTIRWLFGNTEPIPTEDGEEYWQNGIYCPTTSAEVQEHADILGINEVLLIH